MALRPLSGSDWTVLAESTSPTVADSVWSTVAWAVTSTVSSRAPTSIFRSTRAICFASSVIGRVDVVLNPLSARLHDVRPDRAPT